MLRLSLQSANAERHSLVPFSTSSCSIFLCSLDIETFLIFRYVYAVASFAFAEGDHKLPLVLASRDLTSEVKAIKSLALRVQDAALGMRLVRRGVSDI